QSRPGKCLWAERGIPGCRLEAVAVAWNGPVAHRIAIGFQYLWLTPFVLSFGEQPQLVPVPAGMFLQVEKITAGQLRLIAFALVQHDIMAVCFQSTLSQLAPAIPVAESSRIAIVLALPALRGAFQVQAGLQEIVIAQGHRLGARLQAHRERLDGG